MTLDWCDAHLDLAWLAVRGWDLAAAPPDGFAISLESLRDGNVRWVFGTVFTGPGFDREGGYPRGDIEAAREQALMQLEVYPRLEDAGLIRIVRTKADLDADVGLRVVLLMEGADPIRDPSDVAWWYAQGVRAVGLSWWSGTRFAGGNGVHGPLTAPGREMVAALDEAGIVHDLSHLADESAHELLELARGPVIASHSNARALMDGEDQRHLSDELIRAIGDRDGVIGLNLFNRFLVGGERRATVDEAIAHVEHVASVGGRRSIVGLGSDADGGFGTEGLPEGIGGPSDYSVLSDALSARGWSSDEVRGFANENWLRVLREAL